jgi:hypothetical protein
MLECVTVVADRRNEDPTWSQSRRMQLQHAVLKVQACSLRPDRDENFGQPRAAPLARLASTSSKNPDQRHPRQPPFTHLSAVKMKYVNERPLADPEAAALRLIEIANTSRALASASSGALCSRNVAGCTADDLMADGFRLSRILGRIEWLRGLVVRRGHSGGLHGRGLHGGGLRGLLRRIAGFARRRGRDDDRAAGRRWVAAR